MLERPHHRRQAPRRELRRERDRRHRERIKQGKIVVGVELGAQELDWLVSVHWVGENETDARKIGEGIARGLAISAKG